MPGNGAFRPLPYVPARVRWPNWQRTLGPCRLEQVLMGHENTSIAARALPRHKAQPRCHMAPTSDSGVHRGRGFGSDASERATRQHYSNPPLPCE
jgi:hypothetical protein